MGKTSFALLLILILTFCSCTESNILQNSSDISSQIETTSNSFNAVDFTGEWHRTNTVKACAGTIIIDNLNEESFDFKFDGISGGHSGYIEEKSTIISQNKATFSIPNIPDDNILTTVTFELKNNHLFVAVSGGDYMALGFGMNVQIDGEYIKEAPMYTNANIVNEILKTQQQKDDLKSLLGDSEYNQALSIMQDGFDYEIKKCADIDGDYYSFFVPGIGEGVDLIIGSNRKYYCLRYSCDFKFYTNDIDYKDILPKFFENIIKNREGMKTTVIYKEIQ